MGEVGNKFLEELFTSMFSVVLNVFSSVLVLIKCNVSYFERRNQCSCFTGLSAPVLIYHISSVGDHH